MSASYVRRYYGVDYKRGDRVTVDGKPGTIVCFPDQYLGVRFDGERRVSRCHPKWRVELGEPEPFGLVDLLARRPELRDVGIAGYLAGAAVDGAPGMPKTTVAREPGLVVGASEGVLVYGVRVWAA